MLKGGRVRSQLQIVKAGIFHQVGCEDLTDETLVRAHTLVEKSKQKQCLVMVSDHIPQLQEMAPPIQP